MSRTPDLPASPRTSRAWWNASIEVLMLGIALLILTPPIADPDLWGHVRFGLDLWQTGQIVRPDNYSYLTTGQRWINHEWLSEALYAFLYSGFEGSGLAAFNIALGLLIVGLLCRHLRKQGANYLIASLLTILITLLLRPCVLNIRPQTFTYTLFAVTLLLLHAAVRGAWRWLWLMPLVIALWINLHGGVLAGAGILLVWGTVYVAESVWRARRLDRLFARPVAMIAICIAASTLALLLNPYGSELVAFLLRTATVPRPEISEWQPIRVTTTWGQLWLLGCGITAFGLIASRRKRCLPEITVLLCVALLPLLSARHVPLFAVATPIFAGEHIADTFERWRQPLDFRLSGRAGGFVMPFLLAAALLSAAAALPRLSHIAIDPASANFPAAGVALLKAANVRANLAVEFNWGEYALWHLGPGIKVSVDGRRETVYSAAIYRENLDFMLGAVAWNQLVDRPETDLALVDRARPVYDMLQRHPKWGLVYEDSLCAIFARRNSPLAERLGRLPSPALSHDGAGLAFP